MTDTPPAQASRQAAPSAEPLKSSARSLAMTVNTRELRGLVEKATPGRWIADGKAVSSDHGHRTSICGTYGIAWPCGSYSNAEADAALIAAARNALPALLDEIDALRAALDALVSDIECLVDETQGVYGLHHNGDPSPWRDLLPGGQYERLSALDDARAVLAEKGA